MRISKSFYVKFILVVVILTNLVSCVTVDNFTKSSKLDKSKMVAQAMTEWYSDVYKLVSDTYQIANTEKKTKMRSTINPAMNNLKKLIRVYIVSLQLIENSSSDVATSDDYLMDVAKCIAEVQSALKSIGLKFPEFMVRSN